jgi:hypothetical protein
MSSPSRVSRPSTLAPEISSCMRLMERRNVDLPQPDGPMRAVTLFGLMRMLTPFTARKDP